jgi:two-component system OmpR family sensor kinase
MPRRPGGWSGGCVGSCCCRCCCCGCSAVSVRLWALHGEIREVLDSALEETAQRLLMLPEAALARPTTAPSSPPSAITRSTSSTRSSTVTACCACARTGRRWRRWLASGSPASREQGGFRVISMRRADGRRVVHVAETLAHRREVVWDSLPWLLLPLLAVLPLAAWVLHSVLRAGLPHAPAALEVLDGSAAPRLRPLPLEGTPGELRPLLSGMNMLIERVRMLVDAERSFAARTAHELRTPLAAARAQAQRLLAATHEAPAHAHGERLLVQLDRLSRLSSRLLQIARVESGIALQRAPVDLTLLARLVADEFRAAPEAPRLRLDLPEVPVVVDGDIDALSIAVRNLLDNALKHSQGAPVVLRVAPGRIAVEDAGPGIDTASLERIRRPFERGSGDSEGTGLGLAMVESVARQSGARLELQSPLADGRGLRAALVFVQPPAPAHRAA